MNILILNWRDVRHPKSGGAELVTMEHAKSWVAAGNRVTWLTARYKGTKKESTVEGIDFVRRWGSLTVYLYAPIYLLANAKRFDVIIDEVHGFPFFSPLLTGKPVIVFIHEIAGKIWDSMFPFPKNAIGKLLEWLYFWLYKHCMFWTDAQSTIDELVERGIPRNNCIAIPCPIMIKPMDRIPKKEKNHTFICVSRLVKMKGVEDVIASFSIINKYDKESRLWVVGEGDRDELTNLVSKLSLTRSVRFWGYVTETKKIELLQRAHILLHASVKEGWGLVVLEAASQGTPGVVYNVSGLRDTVKDDQTGILTTYNTPEELARESLDLLGNKRKYKRLQKNALMWSKTFTWDTATKQSVTLLKKVYEKYK